MDQYVHRTGPKEVAGIMAIQESSQDVADDQTMPQALQRILWMMEGRSWWLIDVFNQGFLFLEDGYINLDTAMLILFVETINSPVLFYAYWQ